MNVVDKISKDEYKKHEGKCGICYSQLERPGALILTPPDNPICMKYHLCDACWYDLKCWLAEMLNESID